MLSINNEQVKIAKAKRTRKKNESQTNEASTFSMKWINSQKQFGFRKQQFQFCMKRVNEIAKTHPNAMIVFGGDLNIRDNEVSSLWLFYIYVLFKSFW